MRSRLANISAVAKIAKQESERSSSLFPESVRSATLPRSSWKNLSPKLSEHNLPALPSRHSRKSSSPDRSCRASVQDTITVGPLLGESHASLRDYYKVSSARN